MMYRHLAVNGIWRKTCFGRQLKYDCCMSTASYAAFLTSTRSLGTASDWQLAALNPEVFVMTKNDSGSDKKPDWMNPANDRKTPYTEEEIDAFVEDFILGLDEQEWLSITSEHGEEKTREKIRTAFVNMDENSLVNITPKGSVN